MIEVVGRYLHHRVNANRDTPLEQPDLALLLIELYVGQGGKYIIFLRYDLSRTLQSKFQLPIGLSSWKESC